MGHMNCDWQDSNHVLNLFGKTLGAAREAYAAYMADGVGMGRRPDLVGGGLIRSVGGWSNLKAFRQKGKRIKGDERILGSSDFVEMVLKLADEELDRKSRLHAAGVELGGFIDKVAFYYDIDPEDLRTASKNRTITSARKMLCYLAVRKLMMSCVEVSRQLNISAAAVSRAASLGAKVPNRREIQKKLLQI
jgi:hypothetical protein